MFDEDGNFTPAHMLAMGKRMDQAIRLARKNKAEVALEMEISRAAMTQYCSGNTVPTLQNMARFCQIVKTPMDFIVTGTTEELEAQVIPVLQAFLDSRKKTEK